MISVTCPTCGKSWPVENRPGNLTVCRNCGESIRVPGLMVVKDETKAATAEPVRRAHVKVEMERPSAFHTAFNATCGVMAALLLVPVLVIGFLILMMIVGHVMDRVNGSASPPAAAAR